MLWNDVVCTGQVGLAIYMAVRAVARHSSKDVLCAARNEQSTDGTRATINIATKAITHFAES